jgi:hypothetical protein
MTNQVNLVELKPGPDKRDYVAIIQKGLETAKKEGIEVSALEIALDLQEGISELYSSLSSNFDNPVYEWLCLAELCELNAAYYQIEGKEKETYFLGGVPAWAQVLLGLSALNLRSIVDEFKHAENKVNQQINATKSDKISGPKSHKKILEALYLIADGKNHFLQAARQGIDLGIKVHANHTGLTDDEAAKLRQKIRKPEIFTDPTSEKQGDQQAANRHHKLKLKEVDQALKPFVVVPAKSKRKNQKTRKKAD